MAIDYNGACLLADAVKRGTTLGDTVTIGHLDLLTAPASPLDILARADLTNKHPNLGKTAASRVFADDFLQMLGATKVTPLDASAYEGAELVHDLNNPLPEHLKESFDTVIDGGSLEHIFNVPEALKNFMLMLRTGGHLIIHTPANSAFGHGLYQFSPELFFRALSEENGFTITRMIAHEMSRDSKMYEVLDPADVGWRADLVTSLPAYLFVIAKKTASKKIFATWPQQADYQAKWDNHASASTPPLAEGAPAPVSLIKKIATSLPPSLQSWLHRHVTIKWQWKRTLDTGRCFRPYRLFQ